MRYKTGRRNLRTLQPCDNPRNRAARTRHIRAYRSSQRTSRARRGRRAGARRMRGSRYAHNNRTSWWGRTRHKSKGCS
eukprot:scaffold1529_cov33-Tisochrysis_lutea.AAC.2